MPAPIQLYPHLDASVDHLLSAFEVYSKLDNVTIVDRKWLRFGARSAETNMIEKCPGRTFDVLDIPFSLLEPELAMTAAHYLTLEANGGRRWCIDRNRGMIFSLGISANLDCFLAGR